MDSPWSGGDILQSMTRKERTNLQKRLVLRHYTQLLDPSDAKDYRTKLMKCTYSLMGAMLMIPFVAYHIIVIKRNPAANSRPLVNGLIIQVLFSMLNYRYAKQYHEVDMDV